MIILVEDAEIIIDEEDWHKISSWTLRLLVTDWATYVQAYKEVDKIGRIFTYIHRIIMDAPEGIYVDHIDGNTFNNRKNNLRLVTNAQNQQNRKYGYGRSKYKEVSRYGNGRWRSKIVVEGKGIHLGYFDLEEDAAKAYDRAALEHFKEFANTNFNTQQTCQ